MTNGTDSANPHWTGSFAPEPGLTKREYFAAMALQGIIAYGEHRTGIAANFAVVCADDLIATLNLQP